ncbi:MAG: hypothetical protein QNK82_09970 [Akkermansiaceae bacterium]
MAMEMSRSTASNFRTVPSSSGSQRSLHDEGGKDYDEKDQHRKRTFDNDHEARLSDDEVEQARDHRESNRKKNDRFLPVIGILKINPTKAAKRVGEQTRPWSQCGEKSRQKND